MSLPLRFMQLSTQPITFSGIINYHYPIAPMVTLRTDDTKVYIRAVLFLDSEITNSSSDPIIPETSMSADGELLFNVSYCADDSKLSAFFAWVVELAINIDPSNPVNKVTSTLINTFNDDFTSFKTTTLLSAAAITSDPETIDNFNAFPFFTDVTFSAPGSDVGVPFAYPIAPFVTLRTDNEFVYIRAIVFIEAAIVLNPNIDCFGIENKVLSYDVNYCSSNHNPSSFTAWMIETKYGIQASPIDQVQLTLTNKDPKTSRGTMTTVPKAPPPSPSA